MPAVVSKQPVAVAEVDEDGDVTFEDAPPLAGPSSSRASSVPKTLAADFEMDAHMMDEEEDHPVLSVSTHQRRTMGSESPRELTVRSD